MLLKAERVSAHEDGGLAAFLGACSRTMVVHLTLQTQELFPLSSSDVPSHQRCGFCALPLSAALIFGAEAMQDVNEDQPSALGRAEGRLSWRLCQNCLHGPEKPA